MKVKKAKYKLFHASARTNLVRVLFNFKIMELAKIDFGGIVSTTSKELAFDISKAILDGEVDAIQAAVVLKKIQKTCELLFKSEAREVIDNEVRKYAPKGVASLFNTSFEYCTVSTKYDYSVCGHPEYDELCKIEKIIKARKKEIEAGLKDLKQKQDMYVHSCYNLEEVVISDDYLINPPIVKKTQGAKFKV
jgi:hypothetical protein